MFTSLLSQTVTVRRLTTSSGVKREYVELGPWPCLLQPMAAEKAALLNLALGSSFYLYTDISADITASDEVLINGTQFKVNGSKDYNFGYNQHKELIVTTETN